MVDIVASPVLGLRMMIVTSDGTLMSITGAGLWGPGANTAHCCRSLTPYNTPHPDDSPSISILNSPICSEAPGVGCGCGAWMVKMPDEVVGDQTRACWKLLNSYGYASASVMALVQGWGKVIKHELGYRAQHARICAVASSNADVLAPIEYIYGVRGFVVRTLADAIDCLTAAAVQVRLTGRPLAPVPSTSRGLLR